MLAMRIGFGISALCTAIVSRIVANLDSVVEWTIVMPRSTTTLSRGLLVFSCVMLCAEASAQEGQNPPNTGIEWSRAGDHALGQDNPESAIDAYEQAIDAYKREGNLAPIPFMHSNRGAEFAALHQDPEAIAEFTAAIQLKPDFAEAYRMRGDALQRTGCPTKAQADYATYQKLVKEANEKRFAGKSKEARACMARLFAYAMVVSDKPQSQNLPVVQAANSILKSSSETDPCAKAKALDQLFTDAKISIP